MNTLKIAHRTTSSRCLLSGLASIAIAALCLGSPTTRAADTASNPTVRTDVVEFGDLNLSTPQGIQALYRRIVAAANQVCDSRDHRSVDAFARDRRCKALSVSRAVAAVNRPELLALHEAAAGRPNPKLTQTAQR